MPRRHTSRVIVRNPTPAHYTCSSKAAFHSERQAVLNGAEACEKHGLQLYVYRCQICRLFHLTHHSHYKGEPLKPARVDPMGTTKKPRKKYVPKAIAVNQVQRTIESASTIRPADAAKVMAGVREAFDGFRMGKEPRFAWRVMADAMNVAESLADEGICSDEESRLVIRDGQAALAIVVERHADVGSWALKADEMAALEEAIDRHAIQLQFATYGEYDRAIKRTKDRVAQARAGNASADVIVVGDIDR